MAGLVIIDQSWCLPSSGPLIVGRNGGGCSERLFRCLLPQTRTGPLAPVSERMSLSSHTADQQPARPLKWEAAVPWNNAHRPSRTQHTETLDSVIWSNVVEEDAQGESWRRRWSYRKVVLGPIWGKAWPHLVAEFDSVQRRGKFSNYRWKLTQHGRKVDEAWQI